MAETKDISKTEIVIDRDFDKIDTFKIYVLWKSIPYLMKNPPAQRNGVIPKAMEFAVQMGIEDEDLLNLISIPTSKAFAEKYDVHPNTLTVWAKYIKEKKYNDLFNIRDWAMDLTSNVVMSLYNHTMKKGNPLNFQTWFKVINEFKEKSEVDHKHQFIPIKTVEILDYDDNIRDTEVADDKEAAESVEVSQG